MRGGLFSKYLRLTVILLTLSIVTPWSDIMTGGEIVASVHAAAKKRKSKSKRSSRKTTKSRSKSRKSKRSRKKRRRVPVVTTLWRSPDGSQWIHKGRRGIITHRDSTGIVRAMWQYTGGVNAGSKYAEALNDYAKVLRADSVRIYSLVVPSQGEYYMPDLTSTRGAERDAIEAMSRNLDKSICAVLVNDTLAKHLDEEIFNRTDHHWSPIGAYYAASALAAEAGVPFRDLSEYTPDTIRNYVGTMYKFSGDPQVKNSPELFIYYMPPEGYKSRFVTYKVNGHAVSESAPHEAPFFRKFPDGSGAAYCAFMGGDYCAVKVTNTGGPPGRKILIVKDSYGNSLAPCLFGSFEEVHVVDFRYFPHDLIDYIRTNDITDLLFVNCISIAFNPTTASRFRQMMRKERSAPVGHPIPGIAPGEDNNSSEEEITEGDVTDEEISEEKSSAEEEIAEEEEAFVEETDNISILF